VGIDEFVLEIVEGVLVELKFALERSIGHTARCRRRSTTWSRIS
jgi:hypothetical protein